MKQTRRRWMTALMIFGAAVFGMVIAGGLDLTPRAQTEPSPQSEARPVEIPTGAYGLPNFADLAEKVSPAVVSIEATKFEAARRGGRGVDPFEFFFGPRRRPPQQEEQPDRPEREFRSESGGSGFVISSDGLVVTNYHVIDGADELRVHLGDLTFPAEIKGTDQATDLALLEIASEDQLTFLPLGNSESLRVGEWVMAVGSPLGMTDTVTVGVVSAKGRQINISADPSFESFIQTDAAINFGNSGGPLINLAGEVVGINTAINFGAENMGFAVPVNHLKQILPQLRESGRVRRGFLGIGVGELDAEAAEAFGLEAGSGVLVTQVQPGLPADNAGLRHGDVIVKVDDRPVEDTRGLIDYVSGKMPGSEVQLQVIRNGKEIAKQVTLGERPNGDEAPEEPAADDESGIEWLGLRYQDLTPGTRASHSLPEDLEGVWVTSVSARSPLREEGVVAGPEVPFITVITEVNGQPTPTVEEFERIVREAAPGSRLRMYVRRFSGGTEQQPGFVFPAVPRE